MKYSRHPRARRGSRRLQALFWIPVFAGMTSGPALAAAGDSYPVKPIRLIVGFTPGGSDDLVGRMVAGRITERFGQTVIVDNRPGAGGNVGVEITARANPDGYTISSCGSITLASSPSLYPKLGYDPLKDFAFVSRVAIGANVLFAHPSVAAKSVSELVALARSKPKVVQYGTPGVASLGHLTLEVLQSASGARLTHVPYKGPAAVVTAVLGGEIPIGIGASPAVVPMVQAKRVVPLAVTSLKRLGALSTVPTIAESGFPGFEVTNNHGILAPAGTPAAIVNVLNAEIQNMLATPEAKTRLQSQGVEPAGSTPQEFGNIVKSEFTRWTRVIKDAKITVGP